MNYPPNMTLRPLLAWPRELTRNRKRSPFSATWSATMSDLHRELSHLAPGAGYPKSVLQIALREQDFRKTDGMPRANALPEHPGVILNVETGKGPMSMPCDKFDRWQDNLRAITLSLESLRRIARYGTTPGDEQYRGWLAIEQRAEFDGAQAAVDALAAAAGLRLSPMVQDRTPDNIAALYRDAVKATHPDRNGGDQNAWDTVERAARFLRGTGHLK